MNIETALLLTLNVEAEVGIGFTDQIGTNKSQPHAGCLMKNGTYMPYTRVIAYWPSENS
jgi:hypothetical protein